MPAWYLYILECRDGSLYTGITVDVERRFAQHVAGKGARYTRSRPPVRVVARFAYPDRSAASKAEYTVKQFSPAQKRALCAAPGGFAAGAPPYLSAAGACAPSAPLRP